MMASHILSKRYEVNNRRPENQKIYENSVIRESIKTNILCNSQSN